MSTETRIYEGTVIEKTETRHEGSGVLQDTSRKTIIFREPIEAVDIDMARVELIQMAQAKKKGLNTKMLEINCSPFPG